jgi:hypothetical protein
MGLREFDSSKGPLCRSLTSVGQEKEFRPRCALGEYVGIVYSEIRGLDVLD